jgi:hypothetical protein
MINVSHAVHRLLPIWSAVTDSAFQCSGWSLDPTPRWITGKIVSLFSIHSSNSYSWVNLSCYRVLRWVQHLWCRGEDLPYPDSLRRGCHHLQLNTRRLQARVPALLPYRQARDTGHHRWCGNLHLEGKPHHGECLSGWHHNDLLIRQQR